MDALLQIIVPKLNEIEGLEVIQPVFEWDGMEYPQGSKIVSWNGISLSFDEKGKYCNRFLPPNYLTEEWIWLKVSDESLDRYEISLNSENENNLENTLDNLLALLLEDLDKYVIAFLLHYDQIDSVYKLDVQNCISKIRKNLDRKVLKEGFVIYK
jgi:hypothetical protein